MQIIARIAIAATAALSAGPALAATKNPFSAEFYKLSNTDFIVLLAFLVFVGVLVYFKVPAMLVGLLDKRAEGIRDELDEARRLRDEAQALLASYERKQKDVQEQADKIVEHAKQEAADSAEQAKKDIEASIERKLQGAKDKIASAEAAALREVRNRAAEIAVAAAAEVIAKQMTDADRAKLIDESIETVDQKLH